MGAYVLKLLLLLPVFAGMIWLTVWALRRRQTSAAVGAPLAGARLSPATDWRALFGAAPSATDGGDYDIAWGPQLGAMRLVKLRVDDRQLLIAVGPAGAQCLTEWLL